jgi:hypothetical protein
LARHRYQYRSQRINDRRARRYIGIGPIAEMEVTLDRLQRLERALVARQHRAEQARIRGPRSPCGRCLSGPQS